MQQNEKNTGTRLTGATRLYGVLIPNSKNIASGLPMLFGIGKRNVYSVCEAIKLSPLKRFGELTQEEERTLREYLEANFKNQLEGDLRNQIKINIKRLINIGCYRGKRHRDGLPVRGQRTRTNARTRKGKKGKAVTKKKLAGK